MFFLSAKNHACSCFEFNWLLLICIFRVFLAETQVSPSSTEADNVLRREEKETGESALH